MNHCPYTLPLLLLHYMPSICYDLQKVYKSVSISGIEKGKETIKQLLHSLLMLTTIHSFLSLFLVSRKRPHVAQQLHSTLPLVRSRSPRIALTHKKTDLMVVMNAAQDTRQC